jgi:hypothetical protein
MLLLQVLQRGWQCLLSCHQHGNIRPQVQLFLLALLRDRPDEVARYLLPALNTYETSSYQVRLLLHSYTRLGCCSLHLTPEFVAVAPLGALTAC